MTWLKLDDGFAAHPKIAQLTDKQFRTWVRLLCHLSRYDSDNGLVTDATRKDLSGITPVFVTKCTSLCLLDLVAGEMYVHNWETYRPKRDNTVTERVQRHRERKRNAVTANGGNGVTPRARVPVPIPSEEEQVLPPFVSQYVGVEDGKGSTTDQLLALASRPEDKQKLERASKGLPEVVLIEALDAAAGSSVRDPLGAALARLKVLRTGRQALPPPEPVAPEAAPTVSPMELAEAFIRTVGAGYERRTMDEELTARGIVGADHARLLALHAGLEPLEAA